MEAAPLGRALVGQVRGNYECRGLFTLNTHMLVDQGLDMLSRLHWYPSELSTVS